MELSKISSLIPSPSTDAFSSAASPAVETGSNPSFSSVLKKSIGDVNELMAVAEKKQLDLAVGKMENLHDAMISTEKAETALKFLVQVRNKAMDAYHEIMRMQV